MRASHALATILVLSGLISLAVGAEHAPDASDSIRTMEVLVSDEAGAPLKGARVHASSWEVVREHSVPNGDFIADDNGIARVLVPRKVRILRLWPSMPGYVPEFLNFAEGTHDEGELIPDRYHFKLAKGSKLSGVVVDENGEPIPGVQVEVSVEVREPAWGANPEPMISTWLTDEDFNEGDVFTDEQGRWAITDAPAKPAGKDFEFELKLTHEDYVRDSNWGELQKAQGVTTEMLRAGTARIVLRRGIPLEGVVVDTAGNPVKKGLVTWSDRPYWAEGVNETQIDASGRFATIPLPLGEYPITVMAPGYSPQQRIVKLGDFLEPLRFEMSPGNKFVMKVVDRQGRSIPDVYVGIGYWRGAEALYNEKHPNVPESGIPRHSDANGVYTWDWAPEDAVTYHISKKGYASQSVSLVAKSTPHVVTLPDERVATGMVTDAETGAPVAKFSAMPVIVFRKDFYHTRREDAKEGHDGHYEVPLTGSADPDDRYRVRFEADGYQSLVSEESFGPLDGRATLNVTLKPAPARAGQVVDAAGRPVAGAVVLEGSPTDVPHTSNTEPDTFGWQPIRTDAQGRFAFRATSEPVLVRVLDDRGFVEVRYEPDESFGILRLQPWARVEGKLMQDGRPVEKQTVLFSPTQKGKLREPRFQDSYSAETDAEGRFEFERLPPILGAVNAHLGPWNDSPLTSSESMPLDLKPGEHRTISLGDGGIAVTGKVVATGRDNAAFDKHWSLNYLVSRDRGLALPEGFPTLGFDPTAPIEPSWFLDSRWSNWLVTRENYFVKLSPDGDLHVSGVPVGDYELVLQLYEQPAGCLVQTIGERVVPIEVSEADIAAGSKDIGDIEVPCRVGPRIGENMQVYRFLDTSGRERTIADMSGRYVLMHVWATWCAPCLESLPDMQATVDQLRDAPITFVGLNVDKDAAQARALAERKGWNWSQNYLGDNSNMSRQLAISSVPAYFLIGPDGLLVASSTEWSDIKERIEAAVAK